jgi:UDP-glucose 4-epimerase
MSKLNILVVGGGGYIDSHMVKRLLQDHHHVITLDNFSTGYPDAVVGGEVIDGDLADSPLLDKLFSTYHIDAVFHFASYIQVGESVSQPGKYYRNNFTNTLNLLDAMIRHGVSRFVFSSTAAVYGEPHYVPIDEAHVVAPVNPYGASKAMVEQVLHDYERAYGLHSIALRYFNACGADPDGELGERHLIPLALQTVAGKRGALTVFGCDYDTPDGTCIRDYVHVADLCEAHVMALHYLMEKGVSDVFNLGNGAGFSVAEVLAAVERVTGCKVSVIEGERRIGDPATLVADATRAKTILGWRPRYADLDPIIAHAWSWEQKIGKNNNG